MAYDYNTHQFYMDWVYPYPYQVGDFYVGEIDGQPLGFPLSKGVTIIAGARSGKDACYIIPNVLRWNGNIFGVDVKGEISTATWRQRIMRGQRFWVLDPFEIADIPDRLRISFNPLDAIDPDAIDVWETTMTTSKGLVEIFDPKHGHWDGGSEQLFAGAIALTKNLEPELQTLVTVRDIIIDMASTERVLKPPYLCADLEEGEEYGDREEDYETRRKMIIRRLQNLPKMSAIGRAAASALTTGGKDAQAFLSGAAQNSRWLDSEPMRKMLASSDFRMKDLKFGKTDLFLVLPPQYVELHNKFLRLFTRCGLDAMSPEICMPNADRKVRVGDREGERCLFLLNEFHSMGRMVEIEKGAGRMPAYGVHLVIVAQDIGQLTSTYGKELTRTFFANSDLQIFFGMTDDDTPRYVSDWIGPITYEDLGVGPAQLEALEWFALPPNSMGTAMIDAPDVPGYLLNAASQVPQQSSVAPIQSQKMPLLAATVSGMLQSAASASYARQATDAAYAGRELQLREMHRQTRHQNERARIEAMAAQAKAEYEQNRRREEIALAELRRQTENLAAVVRHATSMVGKPRVSIYDTRVGTAKMAAGDVAEAALILTAEGVRIVKPHPYFRDETYNGRIAS